VLNIASNAIEFIKHRLDPKGDQVTWHVGDITANDFLPMQLDL